MIISENVLINYDIPIEWFDWFKHHYVKGNATFEQLIVDGAPIEFLHQIVKYVNISDNDYQMYLDRCKIIDSAHVISSENVRNSNYIFYSNDVKDSTFVRYGSNVDDSEYIYRSTNVLSAREVVDGSTITGSRNVIDSSDIIESENILSSRNIIGSSNINNCSDIEGSTGIFMSKNIQNSMFCGFCENVKNSLFCINTSNINYHLFNQPINPAEFELYKEELTYWFWKDRVELIHIYKDEFREVSRFEYSIRFDALAGSFSPKFYEWVKSLPNFNMDIAYNLFFNQI